MRSSAAVNASDLQARPSFGTKRPIDRSRRIAAGQHGGSRYGGVAGTDIHGHRYSDGEKPLENVVAQAGPACDWWLG